MKLELYWDRVGSSYSSTQNSHKDNKSLLNFGHPSRIWCNAPRDETAALSLLVALSMSVVAFDSIMRQTTVDFDSELRFPLTWYLQRQKSCFSSNGKGSKTKLRPLIEVDAQAHAELYVFVFTVTICHAFYSRLKSFLHSVNYHLDCLYGFWICLF